MRERACTQRKPPPPGSMLKRFCPPPRFFLPRHARHSSPVATICEEGIFMRGDMRRRQLTIRACLMLPQPARRLRLIIPRRPCFDFIHDRQRLLSCVQVARKYAEGCQRRCARFACRFSTTRDTAATHHKRAVMLSRPSVRHAHWGQTFDARYATI